MSCVKCGNFVSYSAITGRRCVTCWNMAGREKMFFLGVFLFCLGVVTGIIWTEHKGEPHGKTKNVGTVH